MTYLDISTHLEASIILLAIFIVSLRFRFVDLGGIVTSFIVGYLVYVFGGREYFLVLIIFFLVSVVLTKIRVRRVRNLQNKEDGVRGWRNVIANGCTATVAAVMAGLSNDEKVFFAAYLGAISSAFADTLGTEVGLLYPRMPRLITSMKKVNPGTPGGITPLGYLGGFAGLTILTIVISLVDRRLLIDELAAIIYPSGLVGMTMDSLLGAGIQAKYRCIVCGKLTESPIHCGQHAEHVEGFKLINTHTVNFIATVIGTITALTIFRYLY